MSEIGKGTRTQTADGIEYIEESAVRNEVKVRKEGEARRVLETR
jgi:hypothetical protein